MVSLAVLAALAVPSEFRAAALAQDVYGLGDGSDGAYTASTANDVVNVYSALVAPPSGATLTVVSTA